MNPRQIGLAYIRFMVACGAWVDLKPGSKVLVVGLGSGSLAAVLRLCMPQVELHVVEINRSAIAAAREHFGFTYGMGDGIHVIHDDIAAWLSRPTCPVYDAVFMDAYLQDGSVPPQLTEQQFSENLKAHLSVQGVVVANIAGDDDAALQSAALPYQRVFPNVWKLEAIAEPCCEPYCEASVMLPFRTESQNSAISHFTIYCSRIWQVPCSHFANTVLVSYSNKNTRKIGDVLITAQDMVAKAELPYDLAGCSTSPSCSHCMCMAVYFVFSDMSLNNRDASFFMAAQLRL